MKKDYSVFYHEISEPFRKSRVLNRLLLISNKLLTLLFYFAYLILLLRFSSDWSVLIIKVIMEPFIGFVSLSVFRALYNQKRPYEKEIESPLIQKDTKGNSFPSRHVFSAAIISMLYIALGFKTGFVLLCMTLLCGTVRVIGGVHYPKDVISALISGLVYSLVFFVL